MRDCLNFFFFEAVVEDAINPPSGLFFMEYVCLCV